MVTGFFKNSFLGWKIQFCYGFDYAKVQSIPILRTKILIMTMLNTLLVLRTNCFIWILTLLILEVNLLTMLMWIFLHLMEYDYQYLYLNLDLASIQTWETTIKKWIVLYSLCFRIIQKIWSLVSISQILILPEEIISKSMHISPVIAKIVLANQWFHPRLISDWNMITISSLNLLSRTIWFWG